MLIAISVATYMRPAAFRRLLESLGRIHLPEGTDVEVRVVDNDAAGSARATGEAAELAELVDSLPGLRFDGLMTYPTTPETGPAARAAIGAIRARGSPSWAAPCWPATTT